MLSPSLHLGASSNYGGTDHYRMAWSGESECHGMTSLPLLCPPLATSNHLHLHSTSSASALLQLQCILVQLIQLHCTHSQTNRRSTPDPFGPGSHAKGSHLYTPSTFVLFA